MRRTGPTTAVAMLAAAALGAPAATAQERPAGERVGGERGSVTVTRGTNITAAVAPDGRSVVLDVQGVLWGVPGTGGAGRRLTAPLDDPALPSFAPDGRRVAFQSYRTGQFHVWTMRPDGTDQRQLTFGRFDDREPVWSPDGTRIAFSSDRGGTYDVWVVEVATGRLLRWTSDAGQEFQPTWSPDGREIAYVSGRPPADQERKIGALTTLESRTVLATDAAGATRTLVTEPEGTIASPSWSPDGAGVAYVLAGSDTSTLKVSGRAVTDGEDVFPFRAQWRSPTELVYTADGQIRRRDLAAGTATTIPFSVRLPYDRPAFRAKAQDLDSRARRPVRGIVKPVLSPDGERVAFGALGDLWVMELGERPRRITRDRFLEDDPAWSPDGRRLAYTSDRAGSADLHVRQLRTGRVERMTTAPGGEIAPAWSRDGRSLAFQDEDDATHVLDLATGATRPLLPAAWEPSTPTWGPDGGTVALAALRPASDRFREGTSQILTVDAATGERRWVQPIPFASLSNRVSSGPVWSPDGRSMAFVVASRLWVLPVDAQGRPTGEPRRVTDEIAEAPSWSGDSSRLLYLSNGRLRLVAARGGRPRNVPVELGWRRARAPRTRVIHAGALWDGVRRRLRRDVDITLRGKRIVRVERHRAGRRPDVDASRLTVMPGLWDAHVHQELQRATLGARQGAQQLAFGVTTTVSMGDTAYEVLEDREALAAGRRVGPRLLAASEPLDGSRVYYDFMRPVRSLEELRRELDRVRAFDVDLLKTYVRLPFHYQARALDLGHDLGLLGFSHYWEPPISFGQDGMSHISATQRLGFSRTQSTSGFAYDDVIRTARASRASITTTLFSATTLLTGEDRELITDPRVRRLYTPAQAAELEDFAEQEAEPVPLERDVRILRDVLRGGGRVLAGTDLPLEPVAVHLHLNLRAMVGGGLTPYEALRTATAEPAEHFGLADDLGTVREGRIADLAFVRGNPLRDVDAAADVRMIMTEGRLRRLPELLAPFPGR